MDKDHETREANKEFHEQRSARLDAAASSTAKKRDKRKRQKEQAAKAKKLPKVENKFKDDGSFLRDAQKRDEEAKEAVAARQKAHMEEQAEALAKGETVDLPKTDMTNYASAMSGPKVTAEEM